MQAPSSSGSGEQGKSGLFEFSEVLAAEYSAIHERRGGDAKSEKPSEVSGNLTREELQRRMFDKETSALCLSGGGIRSASFCLGAVQALASAGFLRNFHYLSSVSGGGYLGSMLAAWGYRAGRNFAEVEDGLAGKPVSADPEKKSRVPDPVGRLRDFTSYLAPRYGLFSFDTWTLFSTYVRNLLLNWLMLIPLLCAVFLLPHLLVAITNAAVQQIPSVWALRVADWALLTGIALSALAVAMWRGTSRLLRDKATRDPRVIWSIVVCALIAGFLICGSSFIIRARSFDHEWTAPLRKLLDYGEQLIGWAWLDWVTSMPPLLRLALVYALLGFLTWVWFLMRRGDAAPSGAPEGAGSMLVAFLIAGAATGLGLHGWHELLPIGADQAAVTRYFWTFGPPSVGTVFAAGEILLIGLVSKLTDDFDREWWARMGAYLLVAALVWMALFSIVLLAPALLRLYLPKAQLLSPALGALVLASGALIARLAFTRPAATVSAAKDTSAAARKRDAPVLSTAGFAFLVLFLCGVSYALDMALNRMGGTLSEAATSRAASAFAYRYDWRDVLMVLAGVAALLLVIPRYIHINRFSLHGMYRERLIRAFLGGTRVARDVPAGADTRFREEMQYSERKEDAFTRFDRHDNPILWWLDPRRHDPITPACAPESGPKSPPYLIVNCALNLAGDDRLAWQERKAASFTFTALHSGSEDTRYRASRDYAGEVGGITLGTALTISGAAVSPNAGLHSSPVLTAVLTLFNARLGSWLGNPGYEEESRKQGPTQALGALVNELLGRTKANDPWVHLSDGGHFDNLGLYEVVKRGCRYIVAIDASADPAREYADLGGALRKIRLDLDVDAELVGNWWIGNESLGAAGKYCTLFSIRYNRLPQKPQGSLLYVKPCIYPHPSNPLPMDVSQFYTSAQGFPHESTVNQFFTESQFESYRALGEHELETILKHCKAPGDFFELIAGAQRYIFEKPAGPPPVEVDIIRRMAKGNPPVQAQSKP